MLYVALTVIILTIAFVIVLFRVTNPKTKDKAKKHPITIR